MQVGRIVNPPYESTAEVNEFYANNHVRPGPE